MRDESAEVKDKVCVITGATSGIGLAMAGGLAEMGARLILVGRDEARGEIALREIARRAPGADARIYYADLQTLKEMHRVGREIAAAEDRIDILINNAGATFAERQITEDGLERTFALNHMAYFVLTRHLRDRLVTAAPARIINTASDVHRRAKLDLDDLQFEQGYSGFQAYCRSKLANILFTRELARRLAGTGVVANSFHPGFVASRFGEGARGGFGLFFTLARRFAITPEEGAQTGVYLAAAPEAGAVTGGFFAKLRAQTPAKAARDNAAAARLWNISTRIAGGTLR